MPVEALNCPMCGASVSSDSTSCEHCGARLATVSCPSCFGVVFEGSKFCSHCGAKIERTEVASDTHEKCPRCKVEMQNVLIGKTHLEECAHCEGLWADADAVREICTDREEQAAVLGMANAQPASGVAFEENIHYIPCPVCQELMNRVNFAHCSNIIVNVCNQHGTWFDKDELRRLVDFIRAGGMEKCRTQQIEEWEQKKNEVSAPVVPMSEGMLGSGRVPRDLVDLGISAVAWGIEAFLRK